MSPEPYRYITFSTASLAVVPMAYLASWKLATSLGVLAVRRNSHYNTLLALKHVRPLKCTDVGYDPSLYFGAKAPTFA